MQEYRESILEELKVSNETLTGQLDDLEQYTRRTNIRIYGIPESNVESADSREDTDILSLNFVKEELGVDLKLEDISRSHRVGKGSSKPRPIIVRLSRHNTKVDILRKRKMRKQNKRPYNVQDDLTQPRDGRDILKYLSKESLRISLTKYGLLMALSACAPHNTLRLLSALLQWLNVVKSFENILHRELI